MASLQRSLGIVLILRAGDGQCGVARLLARVKPMDFCSGQGVNRSNSSSYCEDLQRRHGQKDVGLWA
ncbi:hypothetical protein LP414_16935 [Polaromonas sp. P1(28)-13]|nr:hypothetical protein LP414_16935 [Polaromonas sp. P1(28)-13]